MEELNENISRRKLFKRIALVSGVAAVPAIGLTTLLRHMDSLWDMRGIGGKGIVVHHSATPPDRRDHVDATTFNDYHRKRGLGAWYKGRVYNIAYHYVILPDGTIQSGRPEGCRGGHTRSWRYNLWFGICLVGYFDSKWKNPEYHSPTQKQMESLVSLSNKLMKCYKFDSSSIKPHHAVNSTECPGRNFPMKDFIRQL